MSASFPFRLQSYQPASFKDRGLAVPFTTPLLAGARVRPAFRPTPATIAGTGIDRRPPEPVLELVVPNPAGGRGVYIVPWAARRALCCATVHDTQLGAALELRMQATGALSPSLVRHVAWEVASAGFAGRPAATAARLALDRAARGVAATRRNLLLALVRQVEGAGCAAPELEGRDALGRRAQGCVERIARGTPFAADALTAALEQVAVPAYELGFGYAGENDDGAGNVLRQISALQGILQHAGLWLKSDPGPQRAPAIVVAAAAELSLAIARRLVPKTERRFDDLAHLLVACCRAPACVLDELCRPGWLLDGWERVCMIWRTAAERSEQLLVLPEMAALVPLIPDEADDWLDLPGGTLARGRPRVAQERPRAATSSPASLFDLIARNERLCAAMTWTGT